MIRALWTAATGMQAQQLNIDVISNNLANVNTTGFKHSRTDFQDLLYANLRPAGAETAQTGTQVPAGIQLGHGVKAVGVTKEFSQGSGVKTDEGPFNVDLMIQGEGFFQIELPNGDFAYTRDGNFTLNKDNEIVTAHGYLMVATGRQENDERITIEQNGLVSRTDSAGITQEDVQITLARFINQAGLTAIGDNLFIESAASGPPIVNNPMENGMGSVKHHYLEQSNVNMVTEMVDMITTQRAYEIGTKSIQTADSMLGLVAQLKR